MPKYDMNICGDEALYVKLLNRKDHASTYAKPTFRLAEYAVKNNLKELLSILSDIDLYIDIDDQGCASGLEIVTFYDYDE